MDEQGVKILAVTLCAGMLRGCGFSREEAVVEALGLFEGVLGGVPQERARRTGVRDAAF